MEQTKSMVGFRGVNANEKLDKTHAQVEFKAHYHDGKSAQIHHEVSHFVFHQQQWFSLIRRSICRSP